MIQNYLKIVWRNLLKHKVFSCINIAGLSVGIAACTIIFVYVQHELSYDMHNSKADRIVRVTSNLKAPDNDLVLATGPSLLPRTLKRDLPEIEDGVSFTGTQLITKRNGNLDQEDDIYKTDPSIFNIFDFDFIEGNPASALDDPNSIVISETLSKKYFGNDRALGKRIFTDTSSMMVSGVFKDRPENSEIKFAALINGQFDKQTQWLDDLDHFNYLLFRSEPDLEKLSKKLDWITSDLVQPELNAASAPNYKLVFTPELLRDVHFSKGKLIDTQKGDKQSILIFSLLAVFILLIALLNYINLTTARSFERAREIGIRKVVGAGKGMIIRQFLFESFLLIVISWVLGNILVKLGLPLVNNLLHTTLAINWGNTLLFTTGVLLVSFLLAGLYPALVMSAYKPIVVLKGHWQKSLKGIWLRKTVMVVQFAIAAALIMGTTVIYNQMRLLREHNLGYNKDQLLQVSFPGDTTLDGKIDAFKNELLRRPEVSGITVGHSMTNYGSTSTTVMDKGEKKEFMCYYFNVDPQFVPVLEMKMVEGRNFSDSFGTDKDAVIVNQAFLRSVGWESGVGKNIGPESKTPIIGVVNDFSFKSLHNVIEPMMLAYRDAFSKTLTIRVSPEQLPMIEKLHKQYFPSLYFDFDFVDESISEFYEHDQVTMSLFNVFTVLAIFVCCLGLYGLVSLVTAHRTKEIGVRKVLGASLAQLFSLLTKDFVVLVLVALTIALPLMSLAMQKWLNSYAYHVSLSWLMFALPAIVTLLVALLVISREVIKASLVSPVKSLKAE